MYYLDCHIDNLTTTVNQELNKNIYSWLCAHKLCLNVKRHNIVALVLKMALTKSHVVLKYTMKSS